MSYNSQSIYEPHCEPEVYGVENNKSEARQIAERSSEVINQMLDFITSSESPQVAAWAVALAVGATCNEGKGCSDRAALLNLTPAALSKQVRIFAKDCALFPSGYTYDKGGE